MMETKTCRAAGTAGLSLIAFFILPNAGCGKQAAQGAARTPSPTVVVVVVEPAERRDVPIMLELAARTEAAATVEVRANVEGRLIEMSFKEGNMVQKGQLLFRIDPRRYEAAVQAAGAAVEKAEGDLGMAREQQHLGNAVTHGGDRPKPLAARRAVPERDLDAAIAAQSSAGAAVEDARATVRTTTVGDRMGLRQAQASLTAARAALETAELDREGTAIRAPIGGLIGRVEVSVGNYVGRGESNRLATISQLDPIDVDFNMSETHYLSTTTRVVDRAALNRIELTLADNSVYPFRGRFTNIGRAVDEKTGTLPVVAQFPNAKGILLPGMSGRVRIAGETRADAVLVSERALFAAQGSRAVYVVAPGNKAALRSVVTEGSYQGKSIVTKGLSGGETVIVEGIAKVRPGQSVTVQTAERSEEHTSELQSLRHLVCRL